MSENADISRVKRSGFVPRPIYYRHPESPEARRSAMLSGWVIGGLLLIAALVNYGLPVVQILMARTDNYHMQRHETPEVLQSRLAKLGLKTYPERLRPAAGVDFRLYGIKAEAVEFACLSTKKQVIAECSVFITRQKKLQDRTVAEHWFDRFPYAFAKKSDVAIARKKRVLKRRVHYPPDGGEVYAYQLMITPDLYLIGSWPAKKFSRKAFVELGRALLVVEGGKSNE